MMSKPFFEIPLFILRITTVTNFSYIIKIATMYQNNLQRLKKVKRVRDF